MDAKVEKVERINGKAVRVFTRAGNVVFCFYLSKEGRLAYTKSKPESQVHDPDACWVPDWIFNKIYRQAAAILLEKIKTKQIKGGE